MALTAENFRDMMLALLPPGQAWSREPDGGFGLLFKAIGNEFSRIDSSNEQLLLEMSPQTTVALLPEWERDYDLPGACITGAQTFTERRRALVTKYQLIGNQSRQFFIDTAASLGYTITIDEYDEDHPGTQTEYMGIPLTGDAWNYVWQINSPETTIQPRSYGSSYNEPYTAFGNQLLECTLRAIAHDHRALFFAYT
jgi:uncharacterized protein YmfQ (DUF2313 family)